MTIKGKQFQRTEDGHLFLMSNEERNLLIADLTARLNYGVICLIERVDDFGPIHRNEKLTGFSSDDRGGFYFEVAGGLGISFTEKIMPYLRPMSSMTKEEKQELERLINEKLNRNTDQEDNEWTPWVLHDTTGIRNSIGGERFYFDEMSFIYDWLNAHHFDYRGLIELGLALEAPEGMYNLNNE